MHVVEIEKDNVYGKVARRNTTGKINDLSDSYGTLMYIDMKIKDRSVVRIVYTGATHTFVASKILKKYGLKAVVCAMRMKATGQATVHRMFNVPLRTVS
ncbi:hypothetical protein CQW23_16799 [Capsicum baccatum]|uniref:Uncharacterized protein n=1 Tax=Capsicum baccatum TaxID=33114 RepID=A0A2G2WBZ2_CAPBA|nr:hypothetical protein CQW23_16799 [Capsicum baccatum]